MRNLKLLYLAIILLTVFYSCDSDTMKCETVKEWKVQHYRIVKSKCTDLVLSFHYAYVVYAGDKRKGMRASQVDSCIFTWQAENESFLILNVCDNLVQELKPHKISLNANVIDSVLIYSNESKQTRALTVKQIETFVDDWNMSETRGYSDKTFDSAFFNFPAYQYKLTVFSKGMQRPFYGYNYIIIDSSNWKFEMSKIGELNYFHDYWEK